MLKKSILCLLLLITSIFAHAQEKWFLQKIDDKVSVNFPAESKKLGENRFGVNTKDGTIYAVSVVDLLKAIGMSLTTFNAEVETQGFVDGFMEGLTPTMPQFKFSPTKVVKVKGLPAYEIVGRNDGRNQTIYMTVIFVDGVSYTLACSIVDSKDAKNKDKFIAGEIYINGK
jgi:hypothetical protein